MNDEKCYETGDLERARPDDITGWIEVDSSNKILGRSSGDFIGEKTRMLYKLIWNTYENEVAPVKGGRGEDSDKDFDDKKELTIPGARLRSAWIKL